uniref:Uncharacterized protein n=1 Tax=Geospiza parvula TaxID=87175 RepID=A0A8C3Q7Z7_GEOPR
MSSSRMFKKLTKFIVNQMDPCKELVPVESIADNEHFRPLYLLKKKNKSKTVFHRAPYYQRTGFTLDDVLLPGEDGKSRRSMGRGRPFYEAPLAPRAIFSLSAHRRRRCERQKSPGGGQITHASSKMLFGEGTVKKGKKEGSLRSTFQEVQSPW